MATRTEAAITIVFVITFAVIRDVFSQTTWTVPPLTTLDVSPTPVQSVSQSSSAQACNSSTFICDNGRCIAARRKCDHVDHCGDNSDEKNCTYGIRCHKCQPDVGNITTALSTGNISAVNLCNNPTDTFDCSQDPNIANFTANCYTATVTLNVSLLNIGEITYHVLDCAMKSTCPQLKKTTCDNLNTIYSKISGIVISHCDISCCEGDLCNNLSGSPTASPSGSPTTSPSGSSATSTSGSTATGFPTLSVKSTHRQPNAATHYILRQTTTPWLPSSSSLDAPRFTIQQPVSKNVSPTSTQSFPQSSSVKQACNSLQFACDNGHCIATGRRCDRIDDCGDKSDEKTCRGLAFSRKPKSPSYVRKGRNAVFEWDYNDTPQLMFIVWSVYNKTVAKFQTLILEVENKNVILNPGISPVYEGRVEKKGRATLVIKNVSSVDSNSFRCILIGKTSTITSKVELVVTETPPKQNLYPYGPEQNDNEFSVNDTVYYDSCLKIKTDQFGFPFFAERHYKLHICRNGIIQLNYKWSWWWPRKFGVYRWFRNMAIFAPFWATTDQFMAFKAGHSKVYYQVYRRSRNDTVQTNNMLNISSQHVKLYEKSGKFANFKATWVLVVTWEKLCPYVYYPYYYYYNNWEIPTLNCQWSNTFQAVIVTNGINSFLMYNYPKGGIQWVVPVLPSYYRYWTGAYGLPVAGWNAGDDGKNYVNMKGSGTLRGMYSLDDKPGNTDLLGRHFWRIENNNAKDALDKCIAWASFHEDGINILSWYNLMVREDSRMACPCTEWQAWFDSRFIWEWRSSWHKLCYRSRRSKSFLYYIPEKGLVTVKITQKCCYSTEWPGDWGALKKGPPDGGRMHVQTIYHWSSGEEETFTDEQAYKYCCVDVPMCKLFYHYRPSDNCDLYIPPPRPWTTGDPHFKTLDGRNYTFNGLGEFVMIDAQNGKFQLQARTSLAQGNSTTATIFTAGAAKEESTSVVEVKVQKAGGIIILIDNKIYSNYSDLTNRSVEIGGNLSASKPEENCLEVSFLSSTSVQFCEKKEMMSFVVTPGDDYKNKTKGLLGTWNDNPDDDYTLPDGTVLSASSTLREIHFQFGVKWQVNQSQSLFTYAQNENVDTFAKPDFIPMFADNITWSNSSVKEDAETQCGDDYECLFDVASTNDLSVGMVTKDSTIQLVKESNALDNFPPKMIDPPNEINATLHQTVQLDISAQDKDTITFDVINKPADATWNQSGNVLHFTWPVKSSRKFNLSFVATDDKGASTTWNPTINMCACHHDGQCVQPEEGDQVNTDGKFIYMGCACQGGYTGRFCDSNIDACEMNGQPCYAGVDCIDLPPPANASGYTCGPCPTGYTGNGAQCAEIDECENDVTNNCKQICINVPGSFVCDCRDGYVLNADGHSCEDINECEPTSDCMQLCNNTQGSYNCLCDQYFQTDPSDRRKCVAKDPCSPDPGCEHVCFKGDNRQPTCACFANYELQSDGKTCKDINECDPSKPRNRCNQICENTQGSYKCSCQKGFQLSRDGYVCEDVNECMDEDLYNCTDEFHKCVNTRGSYKCECEQDLYFIDGKCRGLEKNETAPIPVPPSPRVPAENEKEQAVEISITAKKNFKWDFYTDKSFKEKMASVTSNFCTENRTKCALKETWRTRRALLEALYSVEQVHLLPGYPSNALGTLLVVFYVQQPVGLFIGNVSILPSNTLVVVVRTYKSELETAIGANISDVKAWFKPTTSPTDIPIDPTHSRSILKWIIIGVSAGVVVIILVIVILCIKKKKRKTGVRPSIIDAPGESVALESKTGLNPGCLKNSKL